MEEAELRMLLGFLGRGFSSEGFISLNYLLSIPLSLAFL